MWYRRLALLVLLSAATAATAQQQQRAQQQPAANPNDDKRLDSVLVEWERKMTGITSFVARISRKDVNPTFRSAEVWTGTATYLRPGRALLDLSRPDSPGKMDKVLLSGSYAYRWEPDKRVIRYTSVQPKKGQATEDNVLSLLLGMPAVEARRKYDLRLMGADKNYVYLEAKPRFPQDQVEFVNARLALTQESFLPRQLILTEANGNESTWDIPSIQTNVPVDARLFAQPQLPPGWKLEKAPEAGGPPTNPGIQPRVTRTGKSAP